MQGPRFKPRPPPKKQYSIFKERIIGFNYSVQVNVYKRKMFMVSMRENNHSTMYTLLYLGLRKKKVHLSPCRQESYAKWKKCKLISCEVIKISSVYWFIQGKYNLNMICSSILHLFMWIVKERKLWMDKRPMLGGSKQMYNSWDP
jgi:hypothetical protein